jgi:nitrate/nitrite transporter NarK
LIWSAFGIAFGLLLVALAGSFWSFFAASIAIAIMFNAISMSLPLYIISLIPDWKRRGFALNLVTGSVPGLFFPLLVERLIERGSSSLSVVVRAPYAIGAAITFVLFVLFATRSPRTELGIDREYGIMDSIRRRMVPVIRSRSTWVLVVLISLHSAADTALFQWFPSYLTHRFADLTIGPGLTLTLFSFAYFFSRIIIFLIPDDFGRRTLIVLPGLTGGALMIFALLAHRSGAASILYAAAGFCWSFEFPAVLSEAYRRMPGAIGSLQSVAFVVSAGTQFLLIGAIGLGFERGIDLGRLLMPVALMFPLFSIVAKIGPISRPARGVDESPNSP